MTVIWNPLSQSWQASDYLYVWALDFSADGDQLVSGDIDNGVKVWDVDTRRQLAALDTGGVGALWLAADPRDDQVAFFTVLDGIRLWQYGEYEEGITVKTVDDGAAVASFSPDGQLIAASIARTGLWVGDVRRTAINQGGQISVIDAATGSDVLKIGDNLHSASWAPDGRHVVAVADPQREIRIHSISTGKLARTFTEDTHLVAAFALSGRRLGLVLLDGTIRGWDLQSGAGTGFSSSSKERGDHLIGVGISPNNTRVGVEFYGEYSVEIWDVPTQALVRTVAVRGSSIAFSGDGHRLFVGSPGGRLAEFSVQEWVPGILRNATEAQTGVASNSRDGHMTKNPCDSSFLWPTSRLTDTETRR